MTGAASMNFSAIFQVPICWTSPVPYSTLTEAKLIQRECTRPDNVFKDLLVCRSNYRLSKAETELTQWLGRTISQLSD